MNVDLERFIPPEDLWPQFYFPSEAKFLDGVENYNLAWFLMDRHIKAGFSERPLFYFKSTFFSYEYVYKASLRIASFLKERGYKKGDRIGFIILNSPQAVIINLAIFRIGAISVPVSPYWQPAVMEYLLSKTGVRCVFVSAKYIQDVAPVLKRIKSIKDIVVIRRDLTFPEGVADFIYEDILEKGEEVYILEKIEGTDPCVILHTSGTTGMPKGCVHFAKNILAECYLVNKYVWRLTVGDIITGAAPLVFAAGFGTFVLVPLFAGVSELLFTRFIPERIIEGIEAFKPTVLTGLTSFYEAILDAPNFSPERFSSIRMCTTGGSPLEPKIYERWYRTMGIPIYEGLGATEFLHLVASNAVRMRAKVASFGIPIPGIEVRVVDERGRECKPGELGRMLVKGPTGPIYWGNEQKQRIAVIDGYSYIGDVVFVDEEGYLHFAAREEDLLKKDGRKYSPMEIEEVVKEHPAVKDAGVIEDKETERIIVCISLRDPQRVPKTLEAEVKSMILKKLGNPELVPDEVCVVDYIPRTPAGKILRWKLRKWKHIE